MRPTSLFVVVVYAFVLFGGISDVNGGFLKDLLKFGKKGVDQANEAIEKAESSSKPLLHDFQAHDPGFTRFSNWHRRPTESEAERLADMYPYEEEALSLQQRYLWELMEKQRDQLEKLVTLYRNSQNDLASHFPGVSLSSERKLRDDAFALGDVWRELKALKKQEITIGPLDDMPQLIPASKSLISAWQILEGARLSSRSPSRFSSRKEILAQTRDLYSLVVKIEQSFCATVEQRRACFYLRLLPLLQDGPANVLSWAWEHYGEVSRVLRHQATSLYASIDSLLGRAASNSPTEHSPDFLASLKFPVLEDYAGTFSINREYGDAEWRGAIRDLESQVADAERRLRNLEAGRSEEDDAA